MEISSIAVGGGDPPVIIDAGIESKLDNIMMMMTTTTTLVFVGQDGNKKNRW